MPRPTNTERIDELAIKSAEQEVFLRERIRAFSEELERINIENARFRTFTESSLQRVSVLETKVQTAELQSTRQWQIWLAIIGAFIALAVNIFRK